MTISKNIVSEFIRNIKKIISYINEAFYSLYLFMEKQKQYILPNITQAMNFLFSLPHLRESRQRQWKITGLIKHKKGNWNDQRYREYELRCYDGINFEVMATGELVSFLYDLSIHGLPHIHLVMSDSTHKILCSAVIYWAQIADQTLKQRRNSHLPRQSRRKYNKVTLNQFLYRLFVKRPHTDELVQFQKILNLEPMISNDRIKHYDGFNQVMLNKLNHDYVQLLRTIIEGQDKQLIKSLQAKIDPRMRADIDNIPIQLQKDLSKILNSRVCFIVQAGFDQILYLRELTKSISQMEVHSSKRHRHLMTLEDIDRYNEEKRTLEERIKKLKIIQQVVAKNIDIKLYIQDVNSWNQQLNETNYYKQTILLPQIQTVEDESNYLIYRQSDVDKLIQKRKDLAAKFCQLAQSIRKIIQAVVIAQITVGGVVITSGLAAILGLVLASFPKGPSLTFAIGGITGCIAAETIKLIACFAKKSRLRGLQEDMKKQLYDMWDSNRQMNKMIKGFCKEMLIFSKEIKHYGYTIGQDLQEQMQQNLVSRARAAQVFLMEMNGVEIEGVQVVPANDDSQLTKLSSLAASNEVSLNSLIESMAVVNRTFFLSAINATTATIATSQGERLALTGVQVNAVASSILSIKLGIREVASGVYGINEFTEDATKLENIAHEMDKSTEEYKKVFKSIFNVAKNFVQPLI